MKVVLRALLLVIAFALELWVLAACAVAAYRWSDRLVLRVLAGVLALLVMGLLWGLFAAPRSGRRLTGPASVAFRAVWFGAGVLATGCVFGRLAGLVLAAVLVVDTLGLHVTGRTPVER